ncbi:DUF3391 domain-containing protein [Novosphingobium sp. G106]|uniref:DUF3391 domain-containing protein n=1 Tax=Novosphingobium sp. G106 TaxID=2849500 RepID=UPI001C2D5176|nr:DUF3391 domain-containing protein [Novosphingobium sp. G106]
MRHEIRPEDVRMGMYICGFGGSWFSHPFFRAKFVLKTEDDLDRVRDSGVPHVVIDDTLGIAPRTGDGRPGERASTPPPKRPRRVPSPAHRRRTTTPTRKTASAPTGNAPSKSSRGRLRFSRRLLPTCGSAVQCG